MGFSAELLKSKKTLGYLLIFISIVIIISFALSIPLSSFESEYENSQIKDYVNASYYVSSILLSVKDPEIIVESDGAKFIVLLLGFLSILFIALITAIFILAIQRIAFKEFADKAIDAAVRRFTKKDDE